MTEVVQIRSHNIKILEQEDYLLTLTNYQKYTLFNFCKFGRFSNFCKPHSFRVSDSKFGNDSKFKYETNFSFNL